MLASSFIFLENVSLICYPISVDQIRKFRVAWFSVVEEFSCLRINNFTLYKESVVNVI